MSATLDNPFHDQEQVFRNGVRTALDLMQAIDDFAEWCCLDKESPHTCEEKIDFAIRAAKSQCYNADNLPFSAYRRYVDMLNLLNKIDDHL